MKKLVLCLALVSLVALGGQASAVIGTVDDVPAATLLLPYFEVDLANTNGLTTLFSVNNASATAVLAHVVVWSDLSVPVLDFNIYLTGYYVQTVNMRDIINGTLPRTASAGQDPGDTISPKGTRMMLTNANFLVLDDPTNHLDMESITALNNGLIDFKGMMMFYSHDYEFNNTTANRIIELTPKGILDKNMSYEEYLADSRVKEQLKELYGG